MCTHEQYIQSIRTMALQYADATNNGEWPFGPEWPETVKRLQHCKLVYGRGARGLRGVTQYNAWKHEHGKDLVEICALGEENVWQLAATTIHEMAHIVAEGDGHGKKWKRACDALGLRRVTVGMTYRPANFYPQLRDAIARMGKPSDGAPVGEQLRAPTAHKRLCTMGIGTRGGTSRGAGSGSRLRKYVCSHGQIIRASTDDLNCTCNVCGSKFEQPAEEAAQVSGPAAGGDPLGMMAALLAIQASGV